MIINCKTQYETIGNLTSIVANLIHSNDYANDKKPLRSRMEMVPDNTPADFKAFISVL